MDASSAEGRPSTNLPRARRQDNPKGDESGRRKAWLSWVVFFVALLSLD